MRARSWLWGRGGWRGLCSGGAGGVPGAVQPFEAIPREGCNRWLNLYRVWRSGGFQDFHHRMEDSFQRLGPIYRSGVGWGCPHARGGSPAPPGWQHPLGWLFPVDPVPSWAVPAPPKWQHPLVGWSRHPQCGKTPLVRGSPWAPSCPRMVPAPSRLAGPLGWVVPVDPVDPVPSRPVPPPQRWRHPSVGWSCLTPSHPGWSQQP